MEAEFSYAVGYVITCGLILAVGHFLQFDFVAFVLVGMSAGRKLGWWLSRTALYNSSLPLTIILCFGWGALIGFALYSLLREFNPGMIAKVFAYGAGGYVSVPNYGLIAETSIPAEIQNRHFLIELAPLAAFVGTSLWLVFA